VQVGGFGGGAVLKSECVFCIYAVIVLQAFVGFAGIGWELHWGRDGDVLGWVGVSRSETVTDSTT